MFLVGASDHLCSHKVPEAPAKNDVPCTDKKSFQNISVYAPQSANVCSAGPYCKVGRAEITTKTFLCMPRRVRTYVRRAERPSAFGRSGFRLGWSFICRRRPTVLQKLHILPHLKSPIPLSAPINYGKRTAKGRQKDGKRTAKSQVIKPTLPKHQP